MPKVNATMSTEINLDTLQAANSIKRLTQLVNSSTSAWKAQEIQMRSVGDYLGAAQAKFDGLGNAIQYQQNKIEKLKQEQSQLKGTTAEVTEQYLRYQRQIDQATARLASMENQHRQAKSSLDYHKSGLSELQREYKFQNELSETYVKRLKAEGQEYKAKKEELKQYKNSITNLNKQYEKQKEMLERVAKQSGKTSKEYLIQRKRLDETATSMAHARNAANKLNDEIKKIEHSKTIIGRLKNSFEHLGNEIDKTETKSLRLKGVFGATFAANLISNAFLNALGRIKSKFDEIRQAGAEYVKQQQTMSASWLTLTGSAEEGQKMVDMTNEMATSMHRSSEMVGEMNQKFYAVTHNTDLTKQQTEAILTLQDAFGQTDAAIDNFSTQWSQMIANGKVTGQDMLSIINTFPEMKNQLKEVAAQELGIAEMTQEKYAELQSEGKITAEMAQKALFTLQEKYKDASANFAQTIGGLERAIQNRMPAVIAAFQKPIYEMKNPFMKQLGDWLYDPNTENKFKELGEHVSKGLSTIMDAFSKVFNIGNGTEKLNGLMDNLNKFVDNLSQKIADNAPKIVGFFTETKQSLESIFSIGKDFAIGAWETASGVIKGIADAFNLMTGSSKDAKEPVNSVSSALGSIAEHKESIQTVGSLFVSYFVGSTVASGIMSVAKAIKYMKNATVAMTGAQESLNLAMASNPIGLFAVGISAAVASFVYFYTHSKKFKKSVDNFAKSTAKTFGKIGKFFSKVGKANKKINNEQLKQTIEHHEKMGNFFSKVGKEHKKRNDERLKLEQEHQQKMGNFFSKTREEDKKRKTKELQLIQKHNDRVGKLWSTNWDNLKKGVSTVWNNIIKTNKNKSAERSELIQKHNDEIHKWWSTHWGYLKDGVSRSWNNIVNKTKKSASEHAELIKQRSNEIGNKWNKTWNSMKNFVSDRWSDIKGNTKQSVSNLAQSVKEKHDEIHDKWSKTWENSKSFLSKKWDEIGELTQNKFGVNITKVITDTLKSIGDFFKDTWSGISKGFEDMWNGMKTLAGNGINAVISIPNAGIDGINKLISDFGGSKNAISKIPEVRFANGTGVFSPYRNPITEPTLATLNDGNDSPETNNQEMVILPNGKTFLPKGRNVEYLLPAGSEVINASELAMIMGVKRGAYAKGTGFWSKIWDTTTNVAGSVWDAMRDGVDKFMKMIEFIGNAVKDPVGTLAKKFSPNADKLDGMFSHLGNSLYKKPIEEAKNWWKELWSMANASMDEGTLAMGAKGDDYRFKDKAKDSGADPWGYYFRECVSFVASRLANLGVNPSLFSHLGDGNQWIRARVPHLSRPKPGTVAVYNGGPVSSNHVDFVTAVHGDTYDGEEYNFLGDGRYHQYAGRHIRNAATFLDFGIRDFGSSGEDGRPLKDRNNPLQTLIKSQVGGMFDWIKKTLGPLLSPQSGGEDHPQGSGVGRWRKTVIKALKANGIEPNDFRVSKILATIQRESNGDPNAQNNWDINARMGDPSIGLMQTTGRTFNKFKHKGHNNIRNGYDNLLAAINYIKHRYGTSDAAFNRVAAYGYANGGLVRKNGIYELAEGDMPEYVIPTDIAKRGRAWKLLTEAVAHFAGESPQENNDGNSERERVSMLESKLDIMIDLLGQLVANGSNPIEVRNIIDGRSVSNGLAPFMTKATKDYERRQALLGGSII